MIGLPEQGIRSFVPEHLQDVAHRLFGLDYEVNYRKLLPRPKKSRPSMREIVYAQNADFTQARLMVIYPASQGPVSHSPVTVLQGSVRDPLGDQLGLFEIDGLETFWTFAEENGQCPCGDQMYSETSARTVIARSRGRSMHACPTQWATVYHLT